MSLSMLSNISNLPMSLQLALFIIIGLLVGSFLNVVILRIPKRLQWDWTDQCSKWLKDNPKNDSDRPPSIIHKASHCPACNTKIKPWHNVPVFGYLLLKGKCAACKKTISARYASVEIITAIFSAVVIWHFGITIEGIFALILTWTLIVQTGIDIDHQLLLDEISLPIMWLGLILSIVPVFASPVDAILGAVFGYLSLWLVFQVFKLATGKEGMGYGDFKLLAVLGAWLGWQYLPQIILISTLLGSLVGIGLIVTKKLDKDKHIPFGPYLAIAGWLALLWGEQINAAYFQFISL